MVTWQTLCVEPKSTWSHCGSLKALDQRVPVFPSTARFAVVPAFSTEDAVAVLFKAMFVVPHACACTGKAAGARLIAPSTTRAQSRLLTYRNPFKFIDNILF